MVFAVWGKYGTVPNADSVKTYIIIFLVLCSIIFWLINIRSTRETIKTKVLLKLKENEIEKLMDEHAQNCRDLERNIKEKFAQYDDESVIFFHRLCNLKRQAVCNIHATKDKYIERIREAKEEETLRFLEEDYLEDYEKLFCTPAMQFTNYLRTFIIRYVSFRYGVDEDFRVVIKLVNPLEGEEDRTKWEFSNAIWDNNTWETSIKFYQKEKITPYKINSNSAIEDLALNKIFCFADNDLLNPGKGKVYRNHNENWSDVYHAKILSKIENRKKHVLYGFISIDTLNKHNLPLLFSDNPNSVPLNIALYASETLSILCGEVESYFIEIKELLHERRGSIVFQNRRKSDQK